MTEPTRFLDGASETPEARLLRSASVDVSPPRAAVATLAALGLGVPTAALAVSTTSGTAASGSIVKLLVGCSVAAVFGAAVGVAVVTVPRAVPVPKSPTRTRATLAAPAAPSSLAAEAALLNEALTSIERHEGRRAAELLGRYRAAFPQGRLREEAAALHVESLAMAGLVAEAKVALAEFQRQWPDSPFEGRAAEAVINSPPSGESLIEVGIPPTKRTPGE